MFTLVNNTNIGIFGSANGPGGTTGATPDHISQDVAQVRIKEILEGMFLITLAAKSIK